MTEMCRKHSPKWMLQIYLLLKVMRMLFAIIVMAIYCVAVREEIRAFLLTFIANYLIYLIYDSWFFFTFEMNRKAKKVRKMKRKHNTWFVIILLMGFLFSETVYADTVAAVTPASQMAADTTVVQKSESAEKEQGEGTVDVKEIVFGHIGDAYEWHITTWGKLMSLSLCLLLSTARQRDGMCSHRPGSKRITGHTKVFPLLPKAAVTKENS